MAYYPVMMDLTGRTVLVVGGGKVAIRKVEMLLDFGAQVNVISPKVIPELQSLIDAHLVNIQRRTYREGDIVGAAIVIAATADRETNTKVSQDACQAGIPVNVVDDPELCSFIVPAIVRRGDITIAISTSGTSPALAARIKQRVGEVIGSDYAELAKLMGEMRRIVQRDIPNQANREAALKEILDSTVPDLITKGQHKAARAAAEEITMRYKTRSIE